MSVQFGQWNFDDHPPEPELTERIDQLLAPYGPDASGSHSDGGVTILYRALHTNRESRSEIQPCKSARGSFLTWDGRLDNRQELAGLLGLSTDAKVSDAALVAASYAKWRNECFAKLVGDWALAIWDPLESTVILARDVCGVRPLFYSVDIHCAIWSSLLAPLVVLSGTPGLDLDYLASWISSHPSPWRTPYQDIHCVPPASYVAIRKQHVVTNLYWKFDPRKQIRYRTDQEYEEHFRAVFSEAVRRRLRSDQPVLAELSGGMDSTSIVSVADRLMVRGHADIVRLDTVSYYTEGEPSWDERPYFQKVEEQRNAAGHHIEVSGEESLPAPYPGERIAFAPGDYRPKTRSALRFRRLLQTNSYRVLLSGIGGDEVTGGVPASTLELADLLVAGNIRRFFSQLVSWALVNRTQVYHLAVKAIVPFLPYALRRRSSMKSVPVWFADGFVRKLGSPGGRGDRLRFFGARPSFQQNLTTLEGLCTGVSGVSLSAEPAYEKRYPFLDRDLLEFLFAVPREQLQRPGQRRSLMRRALAGVVPREVLERKRKAFVIQTPMRQLSTEWPRLAELATNMMSGKVGIVNQARFASVLCRAQRGEEVHLVHVLRTLNIEYWLRHLCEVGFLTPPTTDESNTSSPALPASRLLAVGGGR